MSSSIGFLMILSSCLTGSPPKLVLTGAADSDLAALLSQSAVAHVQAATVEEAIELAAPGSAVLVLADAYPERRTSVKSELFARAAEKGLALYVEYPESVPGLQVGPSRQAVWERAVIAAEGFAPALPRLRILAPHNCHFVAVDNVPEPLLVLARVAGFDRALFGLPEESIPLLFEVPEYKLIVATTRLSNFVSARYAPVADWHALWEQLLARLNPDLKGVSLSATPPVRPAYGRDEPLPADVERQTLGRAAEWYFKSRLLIHPSRERQIHDLLLAGKEDAPLPPGDTPTGDGSHGILEGYASAIQHNGSQRVRLPLRSDCNTESAMCMALDWLVNRNQRSRQSAENLLDYVFFDSQFCSDERGDPQHPAYGLVAWGAVAPAWRIANYGDDDARVIQAALLSAAALKSERWNQAITRALLANLRTTGKLGFRGNRIDIPALEKHGWKHYHDAETVNYAPHYEAALWACYLWAYARTGHQEFLDKARTATHMTMQAYPDKWLWQNDLERARMILTLAWLVRVEDTAQHREWLRRMADELLKHQDACGAIPARVGVVGSRHFLPPTSNAEYGTREVPLIQENGNPVSDQLYTTGFALMALHEAAAATGDGFYKQAEDRLAEYLCRVQIRSDALDYLDGAWFRAFDYRRWDFWASSGDVGWGAWCIEAGWGQAWATAALAMRIQNTSMWEATSGVDIASQMKPVQEQMARNDGGPFAKR